MIKLTAFERKSITRAARRYVTGLNHDSGYGIEDAATYIEKQIDDLGRFDNVPYTEISDYALRLARFVCPREAREW